MMPDINPAIKKFFEDQGLILRLRAPYHLGNHSVNHYWDVELVKLSYWEVVAAYYVNTHTHTTCYIVLVWIAIVNGIVKKRHYALLISKHFYKEEQMNEGIQQLTELCQNKDWFNSVGTDNYGRYVVYVNQMNHETLYNIPDTVAGKTVLVHFSASTDNKFVNQVNLFRQSTVEIEPEEEEDASILQRTLDELELTCGSHNLQDLFYEICDGKNAITNISDKYRKVREILEMLYDQYGFDVLYEQFQQYETLPHFLED